MPDVESKIRDCPDVAVLPLPLRMNPLAHDTNTGISCRSIRSLRSLKHKAPATRATYLFEEE